MELKKNPVACCAFNVLMTVRSARCVMIPLKLNVSEHEFCNLMYIKLSN